ncbi:MAG: hypothetical protein EOP84_29075, partial [Verrucomicrobiaceae bacterium]
MPIPRRAERRILIAVIGAFAVLGVLVAVRKDESPMEMERASERDGHSSLQQTPPSLPETIHPEFTREQAEEIEKIRALVAAAGPLKRGQLRNEEVIELLHRFAQFDAKAAILFALEVESIHGDVELPAEL